MLKVCHNPGFAKAFKGNLMQPDISANRTQVGWCPVHPQDWRIVFWLLTYHGTLTAELVNQMQVFCNNRRP